MARTQLALQASFMKKAFLVWLLVFLAMEGLSLHLGAPRDNQIALAIVFVGVLCIVGPIFLLIYFLSWRVQAAVARGDYWYRWELPPGRAVTLDVALPASTKKPFKRNRFEKIGALTLGPHGFVSEGWSYPIFGFGNVWKGTGVVEDEEGVTFLMNIHINTGAKLPDLHHHLEIPLPPREELDGRELRTRILEYGKALDERRGRRFRRGCFTLLLLLVLAATILAFHWR